VNPILKSMAKAEWCSCTKSIRLVITYCV